MASAAPPVRYPNVYGIDMPVVSELIANNKTVDEIADEIGADWLVYQDLEDLKDCVRIGNKSITRFEDSCFSGEYLTSDVNKDYLKELELLRSDTAKKDKKMVSSTQEIGI
jgi:amidophosphoribosyltransferase